MSKFWNFEKDNIITFFSDRPQKPVTDYLTEEEEEIARENLKYGTVEYLSDAVLFRPNTENAKSIECQILLGEDSPKDVLKVKLFSFLSFSIYKLGFCEEFKPTLFNLRRFLVNWIVSKWFTTDISLVWDTHKQN